MSDNIDKETTPQVDSPVTKVEITPTKIEINKAPETPALPQNDNVAHALAGAGGGLLSMILTYPLITLSTRAQVESKKAESKFSEAVGNIIAREGISGLYSGINSALFGISITNFVYYYWYEWTRAFFEKAAAKAGRAGSKLTTVESMIAGAIAGSATVIITNPIWVVNTRVTTRQQEKTKDVEAGESSQPAKAPSTIGTLLLLLKNEGPQALFAGVIPALVLVINPILQYTLFEQLKNTVEKRRKVTPVVAFLLGALGKLFATAITYPYITVKSQMHVQNEGNKEGSLAALARIVRERGYAGLYRGIGPKITQSVLTAALLFAFKDALYEQTVRLRMAQAARRRVAA
ncbi:Ff.00g091830.m01.CDS01 [Fusarium sp. VM40]|nr:Ff.00g091830.m01.CDS01 [Fusarium sp. VM40]